VTAESEGLGAIARRVIDPNRFTTIGAADGEGVLMCATYGWSCGHTKTRPWRPTAEITNRIGMGRKAPPSPRLARLCVPQGGDLQHNYYPHN
jgi:hypothetical protein